jgi:putative endonuclease
MVDRAVTNRKLWFLYLIECADGSLCIGITVDVAARHAAHRNGNGARHARSHAPVRLLGCEEHRDRSAASPAEYWVKQMNAAAKRQFAGSLVHRVAGTTGWEG